MVKETGLYDVLGVAPDVSDDQLKRAYKKLAMKWHPDKHGGSDEAKIKFQEISASFETLADPDKRQVYDQ
jgi:DnaJ-class molecular chaperone